MKLDDDDDEKKKSSVSFLTKNFSSAYVSCAMGHAPLFFYIFTRPYTQ